MPYFALDCDFEKLDLNSCFLNLKCGQFGTRPLAANQGTAEFFDRQEIVFSLLLKSEE